MLDTLWRVSEKGYFLASSRDRWTGPLPIVTKLGTLRDGTLFSEAGNDFWQIDRIESVRQRYAITFMIDRSLRDFKNTGELGSSVPMPHHDSQEGIETPSK